MKDEVKGKIISEFVGLKSKTYSLVTVDNEKIKKAKGANKNVVKNISHKEYFDVLFHKYIFRHKMKRIQRKLHTIGTCKISLSCFDDKIYIVNDRIFIKMKRSVKLIKSIKLVESIKLIESIESIEYIKTNQVNKIKSTISCTHKANFLGIQFLGIQFIH